MLILGIFFLNNILFYFFNFFIFIFYLFYFRYLFIFLIGSDGPPYRSTMVSILKLPRYFLFLILVEDLSLRHIDRYLKNLVSKSIFHVMKHDNFQLYKVHPDGVI